jgi:ABC-type amino acid transport substrate-binding protein
MVVKGLGVSPVSLSGPDAAGRGHRGWTTYERRASCPEEGYRLSDKSVLDVVRERGTLRIAVSFSPPPQEGHPPEFYVDPESGEPSGVVCELGKVMADDLGVAPQWVDLAWPEHMAALLAGQVDLLLSYTNTPERALDVEFATRLLPSQVVIVVSRESSLQEKQALNEPGANIGVWHASSIASVAKKHFPLATVRESADPPGELEAGRVDACVLDAVTKVFMEKHPDLRLLRDDRGELVVLAQEYGHPAVRPGDQKFLNWVNNWLDYHKAQGTIGYWCDTWWQSWMVE